MSGARRPGGERLLLRLLLPALAEGLLVPDPHVLMNQAECDPLRGYDQSRLQDEPLLPAKAVARVRSGKQVRLDV